MENNRVVFKACWCLNFLGYQPPLELMRQILTQRGTYDQERLEFQSMEEAMFLASTTLPSVPG